jgi:hypothetical protein
MWTAFFVFISGVVPYTQNGSLRTAGIPIIFTSRDSGKSTGGLMHYFLDYRIFDSAKKKKNIPSVLNRWLTATEHYAKLNIETEFGNNLSSVPQCGLLARVKVNERVVRLEPLSGIHIGTPMCIHLFVHSNSFVTNFPFVIK